MQLSAFATGSVTLAWNPSTDPGVVGYNVYYGGASGAYTNEICVGNATNVTISGLVRGTTYYFAATKYASSGVESPFSSEVVYTYAPPSSPALSISPSGSDYSILWPSSATNFVLQATTNLVVWATVTNMPQIMGATFSVPIHGSQPCQFFRLISQ